MARPLGVSDVVTRLGPDRLLKWMKTRRFGPPDRAVSLWTTPWAKTSIQG